MVIVIIIDVFEIGIAEAVKMNSCRDLDTGVFIEFTAHF
jgi:hypothetical protein